MRISEEGKKEKKNVRVREIKINSTESFVFHYFFSSPHKIVIDCRKYNLILFIATRRVLYQFFLLPSRFDLFSVNSTRLIDNCNKLIAFIERNFQFQIQLFSTFEIHFSD